MADSGERRSLLKEDDEDDEDDVSVNMSPLCDPRHLLHRILVLIFMCFLGFGEISHARARARTHALITYSNTVIFTTDRPDFATWLLSSGQHI